MNKQGLCIFLSLFIIICACVSSVNAANKDTGPDPIIEAKTLKDLEGTVWGGDRWISMAGAGSWGPLVTIKILNANAKRVKILYCWKPKYDRPGCNQLMADISSEDPLRFKYTSRIGNSVDLAFREGRIIGTSSINAGGRDFYHSMYSISLQKVDAMPFPFEEMEFPPFPADAMNPLDTTSLPSPIQRLANKTWEGVWYNSKTKAQAASLRIRLSGYEDKQKRVKMQYAWIYGSSTPAGIMEISGTFEQGQSLTLQDTNERVKITLQLDENPQNAEIHAIRNSPEPLGYVADFLPVP
jgi:hypothetical protein